MGGEAHVRPAAFDQLPARIVLVGLDSPFQRAVQPPETLRGDRGDQGLFILEMGVRRGMADTRVAGHLAQAQSTDPLPGQDVHPGLDQGVLEIPMMVIFFRHGFILSTNLDSVKIAGYNLDSVKISEVAEWLILMI